MKREKAFNIKKAREIAEDLTWRFPYASAKINIERPKGSKNWVLYEEIEFDVAQYNKTGRAKYITKKYKH